MYYSRLASGDPYVSPLLQTTSSEWARRLRERNDWILLLNGAEDETSLDVGKAAKLNNLW